MTLKILKRNKFLRLLLPVTRMLFICQHLQLFRFLLPRRFMDLLILLHLFLRLSQDTPAKQKTFNIIAETIKQQDSLRPRLLLLPQVYLRLRDLQPGSRTSTPRATSHRQRPGTTTAGAHRDIDLRLHVFELCVSL